MLDWENEVLARRQKAGRGNLADDSATNAAIEAASIKKLTFKADSLQRVRNSAPKRHWCWFPSDRAHKRNEPTKTSNRKIK